MVELNRSYMEKSKRMTKTDYIEQLCDIVRLQAGRLTVKQLRHLIAKNAL